MLETQRRKLLETESPIEKRKGGKKQRKNREERGKSFICSEKGEKTESPTKKRKGGKK